MPQPCHQCRDKFLYHARVPGRTRWVTAGCVFGVALLVACAPAQRPHSAPPSSITPLPISYRPPAPLTAARPPLAGEAAPAPLLDMLTVELARAMATLKQHPQPPYFASYEVTERRGIAVSASFGALREVTDQRDRLLDVDVRVGDYARDNTHPVRERGYTQPGYTVSARIPTEDDSYAIRSALWRATDTAYKTAVAQLAKVQANAKVIAASDDPSGDFSRETPSEYLEAPAVATIDLLRWQSRLRGLSSGFRKFAGITDSSVALQGSIETRYYASSDNTRYQVPSTHFRVMIEASTLTADGMALHRTEAFDVASPDELPTDDQIRAKIDLVAHDVIALRNAPIAEPYIGPAILEGKAAGVFFHEVFGHRIEGHRQKSATEGQTFATKIGQSIMPDFLDIYDDPTVAALDGIALNGFYRYDDEGVSARETRLVEHGVLKTFLLGREPTRGFNRSNGHGRRAPAHSVVARQGNLVVAASRTVDRTTLKRMLLEQVKQQGKPYGIIVRELDGGFTLTQRFEPQSFKLLPVITYRIYPDGREELVRGVDLEGTPLRALADILAAGDDVEVFNGYCGAESGFLPVSATSPSLLVAHVELAKKTSAEDKPPILPAPPLEGAR